MSGGVFAMIIDDQANWAVAVSAHSNVKNKIHNTNNWNFTNIANISVLQLSKNTRTQFKCCIQKFWNSLVLLCVCEREIDVVSAIFFFNSIFTWSYMFSLFPRCFIFAFLFVRFLKCKFSNVYLFNICNHFCWFISFLRALPHEF